MQDDIFPIPDATSVDAAFGFDLSQYPKMETIPKEHQGGHSKGCKVFSAFFYGGGRLSDHGLKLKDGVDADRFYRALNAMICSFAPKNELKEAACGLLIASHTEAS